MPSEFIQYLQGLQIFALEQLLQNPSACLAITRNLSEYSKCIVLRLIHSNLTVSGAILRHFFDEQKSSEADTAVQELVKIRILRRDHSSEQTFTLDGNFRANLQDILLKGAGALYSSVVLPPDKHTKDVAFLDSYANQRWECLLHFIAQSKEIPDAISKDMLQVILHSKLMQNDKNNANALLCTPKSFQFLLMNRPKQVWQFLLCLFAFKEQNGMGTVDCLALLLQLSTATLGTDYPVDDLNEEKRQFLHPLRELGLVYQRKRTSQRYYPTRLAINLTADLESSEQLPNREGYIVVETNYRVYAYTESSLDVALIALFCEMLYRFPNLSVALLTRDSVRSAFARGITAEQIIKFLQSYAHPQMRENSPVIPMSISDQIRLWAMERERFEFSEGVLYSQFDSQASFQMLRDYAKDISVLVWDNPAKRLVVVSKSGHDDVKKFWKKHKHSASNYS